MSLDRRRALQIIGGGAGGLAGPAAAGTTGPAFAHGVASGDPLKDRVVIWTRVSGVSGATPVRWIVAENASLTQVRARGTTTASPDRDHTVKVDVAGLEPGRDYWYGFFSGKAASPVGRTRTLAAPGDDRPVSLAIASCSLHSNGLFNAYDAIARLERLDAVVHLGDYIYEYGAAERDYGMANGRRLNRIPEPPRETVSLADYRIRHAQYKRDPDLQAAHARAPWICVFDDHEICNDPWVGGAENHNPEAGEGAWGDRKAAALRAYYEWMPIREPGHGRTREMVYRTFRFGDVASLHMLETRLLARSRQLNYETDLVGPDGKTPDLPGFSRKLTDPARTLMGPGQLAWLESAMAAAVKDGVSWQVIGNQVVMARLPGPDLYRALGRQTVDQALAQMPAARRDRLAQQAALFSQGLPMNLDAWDGYPAERERLYEVMRRSGAHPVVVTGDVHSFWANELNDASGARVGIEFVTTGISSPGIGIAKAVPGVPIGKIISDQAPDVVWNALEAFGFIHLTLDATSAVADYVAVSTILEKPYTTQSLARFVTRREARGSSALRPVG